MENVTGIYIGERVARLEGAPRPPAVEGTHWGMGEASRPNLPTFKRRSRDRTLQTIAVCDYDCLPTQNGRESFHVFSLLKEFQMKKAIVRFILILAMGTVTVSSDLAGITRIVQEETLQIKGLSAPVEILKDRWGISHIYAPSQKDLFFAQGFNVARDRLFQLEIWRRQATGTLAEILGEKALPKDIGARLLRARVDMTEEMTHYHPDGVEIITSFVRGVNAYIEGVLEKPESLPLEFRLLGIKPGRWTPEVVVSRHNGLFRNAGTEVSMAQTAALMEMEEINALLYLHPGNPKISVPDGIDLSQITPDILDFYYASRSRVRFTAEDIVDPDLRATDRKSSESGLPPSLSQRLIYEQDLGSNNWAVRGNLTFTGQAMMANDPHRTQQIPSLRYWVHLNAPGWNVIGGGEPALPGVSIGHNEQGAWGLTILSVDQEDLYVYETHPENPDMYRYKGKWEKMTVLSETIPVKGKPPVTAELKHTLHGPVLFEDKEHHKAYALRAAWLEVGGAPYLASLRMDQAKTWTEFRDACSYSLTPSENMVWADRDNNIGWQAVGITPLRNSWLGLLPVPGDGRYEWEGYLPIKELPHVFNPPQHFFATANQDNIPEGYPYKIGFLWTDPFRFARIEEFLGSGRKLTMADMMALQQDYVCLPARALVPLCVGLEAQNPTVRKAQELLLGWDFVMDIDSIGATIYSAWERRLAQNVWSLFIPVETRRVFPQRSLKKMIDLLLGPDGHFGQDPLEGRDTLLLQSLEEAVADLSERLGPDMNKWQYGQESYHHVCIRHLLSDAVNSDLQNKLNAGPLPRGGYGNTVNNTSGGYNQTSGGSFRIIADLSNWDNSLGTNTPGQSGDPSDPHYTDLFRMWADGRYFPVFFSRGKIESVTEHITRIQPKRKPDGR
jgi:penicillin amidase